MRPSGEVGIALETPLEAVTLGEVLDGACELLNPDDSLRVTLDGVAAAARARAAGYDGEPHEFHHEITDPEVTMVLLPILLSAAANHDNLVVRGRADGMIASYEMRKFDPWQGGHGGAPAPWADAPRAA